MRLSMLCAAFLVLGSLLVSESLAKDKLRKTAGVLEHTLGVYVAILQNGDMYLRGYSVRSSFVWIGDHPHFIGNYWSGGKAPKGNIVGFDFNPKCEVTLPDSILPIPHRWVYSVMLDDGRYFHREADSTGVRLGDKAPVEDTQRKDFWGDES